MGQPVVHFEVIGKDGENLRSYYSDLFGWDFGNAVGPTSYAIVPRDQNTNADGIGIGGVGSAPEGTTATSPSTSRFPTSRRRWPRPRASAARG